MRLINGVYVDGKMVGYDIVTERVRRWTWIPRWLCAFGFMWRKVYVAMLHAAPPKDSNVVVSYEVDNGE